MNKSLIFFFFALVSCSSSVLKVEFPKVCDEDNNGKVIETTGYVRLPAAVMCALHENRKECAIELTQERGMDSSLTIYVEEGDKANTVAKPTAGFRSSDIQLKDGKGNLILPDKPVTVRGKLRRSSSYLVSGPICYINVTEVKQAK